MYRTRITTLSGTDAPAHPSSRERLSTWKRQWFWRCWDEIGATYSSLCHVNEFAAEAVRHFSADAFFFFERHMVLRRQHLTWDDRGVTCPLSLGVFNVFLNPINAHPLNCSPPEIPTWKYCYGESLRSSAALYLTLAQIMEVTHKLLNVRVKDYYFRECPRFKFFTSLFNFEGWKLIFGYSLPFGTSSKSFVLQIANEPVDLSRSQPTFIPNLLIN